MTISVSYSILPSQLVVNYSGQTVSIPKGDMRYSAVLDKIKTDRLSDIPEMLEAERTGRGRISSDGKFFFIDDIKMPEVLSKKIAEFQCQGFPVVYLERFWDKLALNPSEKSRENLYGFLEHNGHPITPTGNFIAYKRVRSDYYDLYSRTFLNTPGSRVAMKREDVDADSSVTCSKGLHVAAWQYAKNNYSTEGRMIEVEVDPSHVVAVPNDYNKQKLRSCEYVVLGDVDEPETVAAKKTAPVVRQETIPEAAPVANGAEASPIHGCYDRAGFVHFSNLEKLMGVTRKEMATLMMVTPSTISRGATSSGNQERARIIIEIVDRLCRFSNPIKVPELLRSLKVGGRRRTILQWLGCTKNINSEFVL